MAATRSFGDLGLSILGLGVEYPPYALKPDSLETLGKRFYPDSPSMRKVLSINRYTGIDQRSSIGTPDHPLVNQPTAPTIADLHRIFLSDGVPLAIRASHKALAEAAVPAPAITHMVSTTCTNSANPGYDHFVAKALGLSPSVEKVLLHGVGCSGGLAALRTAANLCLGHAMRGVPARVLVLALEVSTTMVRSELDSINERQETRIGVALFSDCASAVVLSNGVGEEAKEPVYELLGWEHRVIPDTEEDLGFDVDPAGWKVVLSPRVPKLAGDVIRPTYDALLESLSRTAKGARGTPGGSGSAFPAGPHDPTDFDWAMHPGGATILTGAEKAMGITPEYMRASYDTYVNHGNSSSATIFSVMDRLRQKEMDAMAPGGRVREHVIGCAFGPGITVEMCMLRRNLGTGVGRLGLRRIMPGMETPPETESEASEAGSRSDEELEVPSPLREADDVVVERPPEEKSAGTCPLGGVSREGEGRGCTRSGDTEAFISEALNGVELD